MLRSSFLSGGASNDHGPCEPVHRSVRISESRRCVRLSSFRCPSASFSPRSCFPGYVPRGRAWRWLSRPFGRTVPKLFPSLWAALARFHDGPGRHRPGRICFSRALLVALLLANSLAEWNRDEADPAGVFDHRPGLRLALCRFLRLQDRRRRAGQFRKLLLRFNASVCACWTS